VTADGTPSARSGCSVAGARNLWHMRVERHENEATQWEVARRESSEALRPLLLCDPEGWAQTRGRASELREVPFPGVPLILNLGTPWEVDGERHVDSFTAGMGTRPSTIRGEATWACLELRLTPQGAHRLFGIAMHELANEAVELALLVPEARELEGRLREARGWAERFDLVDAFLLRRLAESRPADPAIAWSWHHLYETKGSTAIRDLASELGWSHRKLIVRFRDEIGLAPKAVARVMRFDRAKTALRDPARALAEVAFDCGYADQAHLTHEFRELAGLTPKRFRAAISASGAIAT
jgi:AraC-like DNA-binding protein